MIDILSVEANLSKINIFIDQGSLELHSEQGMVNEVYTVNSNEGKLLIHIGKHSDLDVQRKKVKRIFTVSQFLEKHPKVPTAEVLAHGVDSEGRVFTVQRFVEGKRLNQVKEKENHLKHIARILAYMHQLEVSRGGYITFRSGKVLGRHKDWITFLKHEAYDSLRRIYRARSIPKNKYPELRSKLILFFRKYKKYFEGVKGKLVHGDLQFDNVLVEGEEVVALVDLEWSCSGDPAWEFAGKADIADTVLNEYFKEVRKLGVTIDEDQFKFKMELYWIIKLILIGGTFKNDTKQINWIMNEFEKNLNKVL